MRIPVFRLLMGWLCCCVWITPAQGGHPCYGLLVTLTRPVAEDHLCPVVNRSLELSNRWRGGPPNGVERRFLADNLSVGLEWARATVGHSTPFHVLDSVMFLTRYATDDNGSFAFWHHRYKRAWDAIRLLLRDHRASSQGDRAIPIGVGQLRVALKTLDANVRQFFDQVDPVSSFTPPLESALQWLEHNPIPIQVRILMPHHIYDLIELDFHRNVEEGAQDLLSPSAQDPAVSRGDPITRLYVAWKKTLGLARPNELIIPGLPTEMELASLIVHETTHLKQFRSWNIKKIFTLLQRLFPDPQNPSPIQKDDILDYLFSENRYGQEHAVLTFEDRLRLVSLVQTSAFKDIAVLKAAIRALGETEAMWREIEYVETLKSQPTLYRFYHRPSGEFPQKIIRDRLVDAYGIPTAVADTITSRISLQDFLSLYQKD